MFEEMEKHFKQSKPLIECEMVENLPRIYNALYPSVTSIATEARTKMHSAKEDMIKIMDQKVSKNNDQNALVEKILAKVKSINERATKLVQKSIQKHR